LETQPESVRAADGQCASFARRATYFASSRMVRRKTPQRVLMSLSVRRPGWQAHSTSSLRWWIPAPDLLPTRVVVSGNRATAANIAAHETLSLVHRTLMLRAFYLFRYARLYKFARASQQEYRILMVILGSCSSRLVLRKRSDRCRRPALRPRNR